MWVVAHELGSVSVQTWSPKVSGSVMSVTGSKALEVGEGHMHYVGILVSRVHLHGEVCFAMEALPGHWKEQNL